MSDYCLKNLYICYKNVYLTAKIIGGTTILFALDAIKKHYSLSFCMAPNKEGISRLYPLYKIFLPTLTERDFKKIIKEYNANFNTELTHKRREWYLYEAIKDRRLYPMNKDKYNEFAYNYWIKKGKPKFGKQIISGAKWGEPRTSTNGKYGMKMVIHSRYVGVYILNNKIKMEIAG